MFKNVSTIIVGLFMLYILIFIVDYKNPSKLDISFLIITSLAVIASLVDCLLGKKYKKQRYNMARFNLLPTAGVGLFYVHKKDCPMVAILKKHRTATNNYNQNNDKTNTCYANIKKAPFIIQKITTFSIYYTY